MMGAQVCRCARLTATMSVFVLLVGTEPAIAGGPQTRGAAPSEVPAAAPAAEEAFNHFERGLRLFDDGDYTLALVEFERAHQLAPNYRALYNIGLVDMQLGRYADATRAFEKYLTEGGSAIPETRRAEVTKTLEQLRLRTAVIDVTINVPSAEITLDGKHIDSSRLRGPMLIDAGEHTLKATARGYLSRDRTVTLVGGDHVAVKLELEAVVVQPVAPSPRPIPEQPAPTTSRRVFWPGVVATGALAGGAIVGAVTMFNARSDLDALQSSMGSDPKGREDAANRVNTAALVADIFAGAAVLAGAATIYLSLTDRSPRGSSLAVSPQRISFSTSF